MRYSARVMTLAFTLTLMACVAPTASAQAVQNGAISNLIERERQVKQVVQDVRDAVVAVTDTEGWGSGVIVSGDGLILTAGHVAMNAPQSTMNVHLPDGRVEAARTLGRNLKTDAALLKLKSATDNGKPWPHVKLGSSVNLKRGDWTVTLGHPGGLEQGRSAPVRIGRVLSIGGRTIVTDGTIIVGDSGGPLFDLEGRLIGVHSMIGSDITNNRHAMIDVIRRDWARLEDGEAWGTLGDFDTGLVGSLMFGTDLIWDQYEARVRKVVAGSPAARAGIRSGDILARVDGQAIADALELSLVLGERSPGDQISTDVRRGTEQIRLEVTLGAFPETTEDPRIPPLRSTPGVYEKAGKFALAEFRSVAARNRGSTVQFLDSIRRDQQLALGTVVSADGLVATKYSEVSDAESLVCQLANGVEVKAKVVAFEREFDIALVKVEAAGLKPIVWQDSPADVGQLVVSASQSGSPVATGVVSVRTRKLDEAAFLGVSMDNRVRRRRGGASVAEVIEDSAAERAGLKRGDVIIEINDRIISGNRDLPRRISQFKPGDEIRVRVERPTGRLSAEIREYKVTLSGRFVTGDWRRDFEDKNLLGPPLSQHSNGFPIVLQHDTVLSANECGGPLLNLQGQAVGINIARAGRVMSYAIPADEARKLVATMIAKAGQ